jgi:hypothetical protein
MMLRVVHGLPQRRRIGVGDVWQRHPGVFAKFLIQNGLATLGRGETLPIGTRAVCAISSATPPDSRSTSAAGPRGRCGAAGAGEEPCPARPGLGINVCAPHVVVALSSDEDPSAPTDFHIPSTRTRGGGGRERPVPVVPMDPLVKDGVGRIRMRVHRAGSGETLSCGTGAAAAALATRYWAGSGRRTSGASNYRWQARVRIWAAEDASTLSGPADYLEGDHVLTVDRWCRTCARAPGLHPNGKLHRGDTDRARSPLPAARQAAGICPRGGSPSSEAVALSARRGFRRKQLIAETRELPRWKSAAPSRGESSTSTSPEPVSLDTSEVNVSFK